MLTIALGTGAALCLFLLSLMLSKQKKSLGDSSLIAWLCLQLVYLVSVIWPLLGWGDNWVPLSLLGQAAASLAPAAQFMHAWNVTGGRIGEGLRYAAWSGVLVWMLIALPLVAPLRVEAGALVTDAASWMAVLPLTAVTGLIAYPIFTLLRIRGYRRRLKQRLSNLTKANLGWAELWAISTIMLLLFQGGALIAFGLFGVRVASHMTVLSYALAVQIGYVGWRGVTQSQVFVGEGIDGVADAADLRQAQADFEQLRVFFEEHKPHRDSELTAAALAMQMGWAGFRLAQALSLGGSVTFYDFVNRFRVADVKRAALEPRNARINILTLALDAGFGSKSAFYEAFSAVENMSPGRWRQVHRAKDIES